MGKKKGRRPIGKSTGAGELAEARETTGESAMTETSRGALLLSIGRDVGLGGMAGHLAAAWAGLAGGVLAGEEVGEALGGA